MLSGPSPGHFTKWPVAKIPWESPGPPTRVRNAAAGQAAWESGPGGGRRLAGDNPPNRPQVDFYTHKVLILRDQFLDTLLTSHAEERPSTARRRLDQQAACLMGGFRDRADATHLATDHDDSLDESYR